MQTTTFKFLFLGMSFLLFMGACTAQVSGSIDTQPSPSPTPSSGVSIDIGAG